MLICPIINLRIFLQDIKKYGLFKKDFCKRISDIFVN